MKTNKTTISCLKQRKQTKEKKFIMSLVAAAVAAVLHLLAADKI